MNLWAILIHTCSYDKEFAPDDVVRVQAELAAVPHRLAQAAREQQHVQQRLERVRVLRTRPPCCERASS